MVYWDYNLDSTPMGMFWLLKSAEKNRAAPAAAPAVPRAMEPAPAPSAETCGFSSERIPGLVN